MEDQTPFPQLREIVDDSVNRVIVNFRRKAVSDGATASELASFDFAMQILRLGLVERYTKSAEAAIDQTTTEIIEIIGAGAERALRGPDPGDL